MGDKFGVGIWGGPVTQEAQEAAVREDLPVGTVVRIVSSGRVGTIKKIKHSATGGWPWRIQVQLTKVVAKWYAAGDVERATLLEQLASASR